MRHSPGSSLGRSSRSSLRHSLGSTCRRLAAGMAPLALATGLAGCLQLANQSPPSVAISDPVPDQPLLSPSFGPTVSQLDAPPPLSGGTLAISADGKTALAADPDRDRIVLVDLASSNVRATLALQPHDEPGRAVEDAAGLMHVVLRGAGAIADVNVAGSIVGRRQVCPAPRGLAYQSAGDALLVACAGGELVTLPAKGGDATAGSIIDRDLRDVIVDTDGTVLVTTLRTATLLTLSGSGSSFAVAQRDTPPQFDQFMPAIAWRTVALPSGGVMITHQRAASLPVDPAPGGYGGAPGADDCTGASSIVHATVTMMRNAGTSSSPVTSGVLSGVVLPVDVAIDHQGVLVAVVAAGNAHVPGASQLFLSSTQALATTSLCQNSQVTPTIDGEAIAAAFDPSGNLFVQTREPSRLVLVATNGTFDIELGGASRADTGWEIFHANSGANLACASCHAEGGDDARTWTFTGVGQRRTQSLRGGITGRAPFHWSGDLPTFQSLVSDVFVGRMSGPNLAADQVTALSGWVDTIPRIPASNTSAPDSIARGLALFMDPNVGCATCHSGAKLTNDQIVNVGTGAAFKVPSLVNVIDHAPFLHDGCAATLADRFQPCGGSDLHGHTSQLTDQNVTDLVAYLGTL